MSSEQSREKAKPFICDNLLIITLLVIVVITVLTGWFYYSTFSQYKYSLSSQDWGGFGSYIGGVLSPLIAGAALVWLIRSVSIQKTELRATQRALQEAASHQENNVNIQQQMLDLNKEQTSIQIFENLFFSLLQEKNNIVTNIVSGSTSTLAKLTDVGPLRNSKLEDIKSSKGKESIKDNIILFKESANCDWELFYEKSLLDIWGVYFRLNYQIVKLIDQNETLEKIGENNLKNRSDKQKQYFDIFRATFSAYEYEALFFNCLSKYGNGKFKELLERYGMFEPMFSDLNRGNEKKHPLTKYAYKYNRDIFEENDSWKIYFTNIDCISNFNFTYLYDKIIDLVDNNVITLKPTKGLFGPPENSIISKLDYFKSIESMNYSRQHFKSNHIVSPIINNDTIVNIIYFLMCSRITLGELKEICKPD